MLVELEWGVLISQSICIVLVECTFENVKKLPIRSLSSPSTDNPSVDLLVDITNTSLLRYSVTTILLYCTYKLCNRRNREMQL